MRSISCVKCHMTKPLTQMLNVHINFIPRCPVIACYFEFYNKSEWCLWVSTYSTCSFVCSTAVQDGVHGMMSHINNELRTFDTDGLFSGLVTIVQLLIRYTFFFFYSLYNLSNDIKLHIFTDLESTSPFDNRPILYKTNIMLGGMLG